MLELPVFANSGDLDQMPHTAASDLGLHCLPTTVLGISRLQWVKSYQDNDNIYDSVSLSLFQHYLTLVMVNKL